MNIKISRTAFAAALLFVLFPTALMAQKAADSSAQEMVMDGGSAMIGDLEISSGFARATLPNAPVGGGYVTITNHGSEDDALIAAASNVAGDLQLHNMGVVDDVMRMYEMEDGIPVPAGETVTLAPGGLHIMFMKLKEQMVEGSVVNVTLTFEKAGDVEIELEVRGIAAKGGMKHDDMKKGGMSNG